MEIDTSMKIDAKMNLTSADQRHVEEIDQEIRLVANSLQYVGMGVLVMVLLMLAAGAVWVIRKVPKRTKTGSGGESTEAMCKEEELPYEGISKQGLYLHSRK